MVAVRVMIMHWYIFDSEEIIGVGRSFVENVEEIIR